MEASRAFYQQYILRTTLTICLNLGSSQFKIYRRHSGDLPGLTFCIKNLYAYQLSAAASPSQLCAVSTGPPLFHRKYHPRRCLDENKVNKILVGLRCLRRESDRHRGRLLSHSVSRSQKIIAQLPLKLSSPVLWDGSIQAKAWLLTTPTSRPPPISLNTKTMDSPSLHPTRIWYQQHSNSPEGPSTEIRILYRHRPMDLLVTGSGLRMGHRCPEETGQYNMMILIRERKLQRGSHRPRESKYHHSFRSLAGTYQTLSWRKTIIMSSPASLTNRETRISYAGRTAVTPSSSLTKTNLLRP